MADTIKRKIWTKEDIKGLLLRNDKAVWKGLLAIYQRQTADEQLQNETCHNNGIGFNGVDAGILSSFAQQVNTYDPLVSKYKTPLSKKQIDLARKKMIKYSGQLAEIANAQSDIAE